MTAPYLDPRTGTFAREPNTARGERGALKRRPLPDPKPCAHCGILTDRIVIGELFLSAGGREGIGEGMSPGSVKYQLYPWTWEHIPYCEACEYQRNLNQAAAILANAEVLPHIKERMRAFGS